MVSSPLDNLGFPHHTPRRIKGGGAQIIGDWGGINLRHFSEILQKFGVTPGLKTTINSIELETRQQHTINQTTANCYSSVKVLRYETFTASPRLS